MRAFPSAFSPSVELGGREFGVFAALDLSLLLPLHPLVDGWPLHDPRRLVVSRRFERICRGAHADADVNASTGPLRAQRQTRCSGVRDWRSAMRSGVRDGCTCSLLVAPVGHENSSHISAASTDRDVQLALRDRLPNSSDHPVHHTDRFTSEGCSVRLPPPTYFTPTLQLYGTVPALQL